uniref:Uncharacterized protein n=1 Tax=Chromera velia CCMP2878 TaxID=1169474 RepID=A0A0G4HH67_9ALVE|eukprot:Cvel_27557.t1-p1 / transcript=Cvel_27557.t1 / gene=Cvel_27557 / organism=Chromera_velia_CCMP2878 / gene_product=hypothetical protein / transcript_product=hypothetical protein / location=Cvel_scaffold3461:7065-10567(-) / protein_length=387 / sequence_SO=supercontig / SO=protein_coding / is_pseudo=false
MTCLPQINIILYFEKYRGALGAPKLESLTLRKIFEKKYGKQFVEESRANKGGDVHEKDIQMLNRLMQRVTDEECRTTIARLLSEAGKPVPENRQSPSSPPPFAAGTEATAAASLARAAEQSADRGVTGKTSERPLSENALSDTIDSGRAAPQTAEDRLSSVTERAALQGKLAPPSLSLSEGDRCKSGGLQDKETLSTLQHVPKQSDDPEEESVPWASATSASSSSSSSSSAVIPSERKRDEFTAWYGRKRYTQKPHFKCTLQFEFPAGTDCETLFGDAELKGTLFRQIVAISKYLCPNLTLVNDDTCNSLLKEKGKVSCKGQNVVLLIVCGMYEGEGGRSNSNWRKIAENDRRVTERLKDAWVTLTKGANLLTVVFKASKLATACRV